MCEAAVRGMALAHFASFVEAPLAAVNFPKCKKFMLPKKPVRLDQRLLHRIRVHEWGLPSMCTPGQIWRSEKNGTITCMVASEDPSLVKIETLPLEVIPAGESMSEIPDHWRAALWVYVQAYPYSGYGLGPLLKITEKQRCDFIREWAEKLVASDDIGCCSIANAIGEFAAYGYQLPSES